MELAFPARWRRLCWSWLTVCLVDWSRYFTHAELGDAAFLNSRRAPSQTVGTPACHHADTARCAQVTVRVCVVFFANSALHGTAAGALTSSIMDYVVSRRFPFETVDTPSKLSIYA